MKTIRLIILIGCIFVGLAQADLCQFWMRYGGKVAVPETTAFYFRWYVLDNARTMSDTIWSHFQITEDNGAGYWTHAGAIFMSRAEGDDDNFAVLNGYPIAQGDTNICAFEYDSAAGTINHKGFYSVIVSKADNTYSPDSARYCSLRVVASIDTSHNGNYPQLTWRTAKYDTATFDLIQLNYNPITGYAIYRSDDGVTGWTRLIPNGGGVINAYTDTTHIDSVGVAGPYYYALRLVYAPTLRIIGTDTLWVLSKLSQNSLPLAIIGIEEQGSARQVIPLSVNPNPARGQVIIRLGQAAGNLSVYDTSGKLVRTLPASREVVFNGTDDDGLELPSGIYFIELKTEHNKYTEKLILQK
ncbi:MAG TPA: T9SS type A sorting domain-containing protein [bacterium]